MSHLRTRKLNPTLGVELVGVDLDGLDQSTIDLLRAALDERGLLLFRGVRPNRIVQYSLAEVLRGRRLPTPDEARVGVAQQRDFYISNKRDNAVAPFGRLLFHSDGMWHGEPFEVLSLHAVDVQPPVPPTSFVNAQHAWDTLPPGLRDHLANLEATHVGGPADFHARRRLLYGTDLMQTVRDDTPAFTAPIARAHGRTGSTILDVSENHTKEIAGIPPDESDALLDELYAHLYQPKNIYQHEWRNGDLVVWDNVTLQHGRPNVSVDGPTRTLAKLGLPVPTSATANSVRSYALTD